MTSDGLNPRTMRQIEQAGGLAAVAFLVLGCFVILRPFVSALLWAAIVCYATWPCYRWLERALHGRKTLSAVLMVILISVVMVLPFAVVGATLADNFSRVTSFLQDIRREGIPPPPDWIKQLPWLGSFADSYWTSLAENTEKTSALLRSFLLQSQRWLLTHSVNVGQGVLQLSLSVLIAFFFYRDGEYVASKIASGIKLVAGNFTQHLLGVAGNMIKGVVHGILGTALGQGVVAAIGFWIAGVPSAVFLGLLTFFFSLLPAGPPFIWIPATIWLFYNGHVAWGIFLAIWGLFVISGIDNLLKPYLISRGSALPFVLVLLGVLGGVLAFGFIGLFLGPTLLAVGYALVQELTARDRGRQTTRAATTAS
jgi:predicted PurR-regulated permease PerM